VHNLLYYRAMIPRTSLRFLSLFMVTVFLAWSGGGSQPFSSVAQAASQNNPGKQVKQAKQDKQGKKEKQDPREMQAREAFAAGNYKDALDVYTKLYAEKLHPTYLRNIGRCYKNLDDRDRAISSFREYLRKAKDLPVDERAEVEGYIKELEAAREKDAKQKAAAAEAEKWKPVPLLAPPPPPAQVRRSRRRPPNSRVPSTRRGGSGVSWLGSSSWVW
jgi:tetratricopeptide (TPR) repeat protein